MSWGVNIYDYGARTYDPAVPRFWQIDPLAEKYSFQSVYVYADDNPVFFVDINGMGVDCCGFEYVQKAFKRLKDKTSKTIKYLKNHFVTEVSATPSVGFQAGVNAGYGKVSVGFATTNGNRYSYSNKKGPSVSKSDLKQHNFVDVGVGLKKMKAGVGLKVDVVTDKPTDNPSDVTDLISTSKDHLDVEVSAGPKSQSFNTNNDALKIVKPKLSSKIKTGNKFTGLDFSVGFKFILGINVDIKIGFE